MGRIVDITITCDRCEKSMAKEYGNEWIWLDHKKKPFYKLIHDVPAWNKRDEFLLCDDCAEEFSQWMLEKENN